MKNKLVRILSLVICAILLIVCYVLLIANANGSINNLLIFGFASIATIISFFGVMIVFILTKEKDK